MKEWFVSKEEASEYKQTHQLFGRVPEPITGTGKWALNFPLQAHVTVHQPHSPDVRLVKNERGIHVPAKS